MYDINLTDPNRTHSRKYEWYIQANPMRFLKERIAEHLEQAADEAITASIMNTTCTVFATRVEDGNE